MMGLHVLGIMALTAGILLCTLLPFLPGDYDSLAETLSAIESSRNRAIRNSAEMVAHIEQYRAAHGRYPVSLLAVWGDYKPGLIGIKEYLYEPSGDAYNLVFEQIALAFGTREFVVYNPRDEQVMTSHANDLLQRTHELAWRRGYYAVNDAPYPHWKYFWFD
jgi:hypothetical protein